MIWRLLLGSVVLAVVLLPPRPSLAPPASASAQGTERVELRKAPPSCEQSIKELGLEGQPVDCKEPPPPTFDPPEMHGPYRLIPATYVGPLTYHDDPPPAFPLGVVSDDVQALHRRRSRFPTGTLTRSGTMDATGKLSLVTGLPPVQGVDTGRRPAERPVDGIDDDRTWHLGNSTLSGFFL